MLTCTWTCTRRSPGFTARSSRETAHAVALCRSIWSRWSTLVCRGRSRFGRRRGFGRFYPQTGNSRGGARSGHHIHVGGWLHGRSCIPPHRTCACVHCRPRLDRGSCRLHKYYITLETLYLSQNLIKYHIACVIWEHQETGCVKCMEFFCSRVDLCFVLT